MRLFLAIELNATLHELVEEATAALRDATPELAWVASDKRHLTLKFLGDVPEDASTRLASAMDVVCASQRPMEMSVGGIGAFPNFRRARVVWIGVEQEPRLELLHHDLELACERVGFEVEGRPFRPHITLARVRNPLSADRARDLGRSARAIRLRATQRVTEITLFESTLAPSGARYRRVHAATLGGR